MAEAAPGAGSGGAAGPASPSSARSWQLPKPGECNEQIQRKAREQIRARRLSWAQPTSPSVGPPQPQAARLNWHSVQELAREIGATQLALRDSLARLREGADGLVGASTELEEEEGGSPEGTGEPSTAVEEAEHQPSLAQPGLQRQRALRFPNHRASRHSGQCRVIASRPQARVRPSKPQEDSEESDDPGGNGSETESEETLAASAAGSSGSGGEGQPERHSPSQGPGAKGALQFWQPDATFAVQNLMGSLKTVERTEVLEDLDGYYTGKQPSLEAQDLQLEGMEQQLDCDTTRLEEESTGVKRDLDDREARLYNVLWHFLQTVHRLANVGDEEPEGGLQSGSSESADLLRVIAGIQHEVDQLQERVALEEGRLAAYELCERELSAAALTASDAPMQDPVIAQVVLEVKCQKDGQNQAETPVEEGVFEAVARLSKECEELRYQIAKEQERPRAQGNPSAAAGPSYMLARSRKRKLLQRRKHFSKRAVAAASTEPSPDYKLFGWEEQREHEVEIARAREESANTERRIRELQDLRQQAHTLTPALEEASRKFMDCMQLARRNLQLGSLPGEEDAESRMQRELKEVSEEVNRKQEAEHKTQMAKLKALEARLHGEAKSTEEKVKALEKALSKEEEKRQGLLKEVKEASLKHKAAEAKADDLQELDLPAMQAELERYQELAAECEADLAAARHRLQDAHFQAEVSVRALKQTRSLALDLAAEAEASAPEQQLKVKERRIVSGRWWQLLSEVEARPGEGAEVCDERELEQLAAALDAEERGDALAAAAAEEATELQCPEEEQPVQGSGGNRIKLGVEMAMWERRLRYAASNAEAQDRRSRYASSGEMPSGQDSGAGLEGTDSFRKSFRNSFRNSFGALSASGDRPMTPPGLEQAARNTKTTSRRVVVPGGTGTSSRRVGQKQATEYKTLLDETERDNTQACELRWRSAELDSISATLEARLGFEQSTENSAADGNSKAEQQSLASRGEDQQEELESGTMDVQTLRREADARRAEFERLSAQWHAIRTLAGRCGGAQPGAGAAELQREALRLCNAALVHVGGSA